MSTKGFEVAVKSGPLTDERLEHIYTSLTSNWMFCSVDLAVDVEAEAVICLIGVKMSDGLDSDQLAQGLIDDALDLAFGVTGGSSSASTHQVGVFV
jgi:hypothetical protein